MQVRHQRIHLDGGQNGLLLLLRQPFGSGFALLLQIGVFLLKVRDLPLPAQDAEALALAAAAGHGAAGGDEVALEGDDLEDATGALLQAHAHGQVLHHHGPAQEVLHGLIHALLPADQIAGQAHDALLLQEVAVLLPDAVLR